MRIFIQCDAQAEREHQQKLEETGFWGARAAGCVFLAKSTGRILLSHRSKHVQEPNTWGTWGGAIDGNELPYTALLREVKEEAGYSGEIKLIHVWTFEHSSGFRYFNFLAIVPEEFEPELNWETQGYEWFEFGKWPQNLHPGLQSLLKQSKFTSLVAKHSRRITSNFNLSPQ
jgi:8-oxo-dGTP pyrophosphatase MutT (NUDIX family)